VAGQAYSAYVLHFPRNSKISVSLMSGPTTKQSDVATIVGYSADQCAKGVAFNAPTEPGRYVTSNRPDASRPADRAPHPTLAALVRHHRRYSLQALSTDGFLAYSVGFNVVERAAHPNRRW
jgi:hypothetical protein